jgi:hypothetical protein
MAILKYLLIFVLVTLSLSQYSFFKNITSISTSNISDAEVSANGEFMFVRAGSDLYVYDSDYRIFQTGNGLPISKISASENAFTIGSNIWGRKNYDFELIQNLTNMTNSKICKSGFVVGSFSSGVRALYVWSRSSLYDNFTLFNTINTIEPVHDLDFNYDGSLLTIITYTKVYFYQNISGGYRIYDMFSHSLQYSAYIVTQILASTNFSYVIARDNSTVKFFEYVNSSYQQFKVKTYNYYITDWSLDKDIHLAVQQIYQMLSILKKNGSDFIDVQNLTSTSNIVGSGNGTLISASNNGITIWKSVAVPGD